MNINLKMKFQKLIVYGTSALALSSVAGISIVQANHDADQPLTVRRHTGTNATNPTPPNTKAAAKQDIVNGRKTISKLHKHLTKTKNKKERQKIYKQIKHAQVGLKNDKRALAKLERQAKMAARNK